MILKKLYLEKNNDEFEKHNASKKYDQKKQLDYPQLQ